MVRKIGIYHVSRAPAQVSSPNPPENIPSGPANFEEAISAAGFGKFNYMIMLLGAFPANWAVMIAMSNIAQIIPSLKCDFQLNLSQVGILNASPFFGNIVSPFLWGYVADTMGRRKLMIWTTLSEAIVNVLCAFSTSMEMLVTLKFCSGFLITAPSGLIMSYLSECHNNKTRSKMIILSGIFMGFNNLILPLLAWAILPREFYYIHAWQLYLLVLALPSLVTGLSFMAFPESPKFLMLIGKHDEALKVFKRIYAMNTGLPPDSYPITNLLCNNKIEKESAEKQKNISFQVIRNGLNQFKPLFVQPYLCKIVLCIAIQFFLMQGVNTLRIWLPEILTQMDKYTSDNNQTAVGLCQVIGDSINKTYHEEFSNATMIEHSCNAEQSSDNVYIKLSIIGVGSIIMYIIVIITTSIINKKIILGLLLLISGISGIALSWCTNPIIILLISTLYTTQTGVSLVTFLSIVVDLFPTSFRTFTVLITSTSGRLASIIGNILFPMLLAAGCAPAFIYLGGNVLVCIIPLLLLSSTKVEDV